MMKTAEVFKVARGHVSAWIEQRDTVHLKAVDEHGDPVELTADELKSLIEELSRLRRIVETGDKVHGFGDGHSSGE